MGCGFVGFDFFAAHVVDDLTFERRHDDVSGNGFGLAEPPASSDGLVVGLVRVAETDEHHLVAVLEVHAEPGDRWFCDEHPNRAVLKRFEGFGFGVGRP